MTRSWAPTHAHGQRHRRWLGRGRHRGRSGRAGPAYHHARAGWWAAPEGELGEGVAAMDVACRSRRCCARRAWWAASWSASARASTRSAPRSARISNMTPEYGSTCTLFPVDEQTLTYLRLTGRSEQQVALVEAYAKAQG
ncbi:MAG: aconitase family protein [Eggerthellaceae bacterium]